jgi:hypothetical protein
MAVEIGGVNFAVRAGVDLEGDPGPRDSFSLERVDEIVGEPMNLLTQGRSGIGFRRHDGAVVEAIGGPALEIAVVAAAQKILRAFGIGEVEALNVEIELQRLEGFAGEAADGDPGRRRFAGSNITLNRSDPLLSGRR